MSDTFAVMDVPTKAPGILNDNYKKDISTSFDDSFSRSVPSPQINNSSIATEDILEWWFGSIVSIDDGNYTFEMSDLNGRKSVFEFEKDEISIETDNLQIGLSAVYSVSKIQKMTGEIQYASEISVNEPPVITDSHLNEFRDLYPEYNSK